MDTCILSFEGLYGRVSEIMAKIKIIIWCFYKRFGANLLETAMVVQGHLLIGKISQL